jgi:hypothetical protein
MSTAPRRQGKQMKLLKAQIIGSCVCIKKHKSLQSRCPWIDPGDSDRSLERVWHLRPHVPGAVPFPGAGDDFINLIFGRKILGHNIHTRFMDELSYKNAI